MTTTHDLATPDLNDPIYTIEHIARLFFVSVDRAREYTYRDSFPAPADLGARNLWSRAAVLGWFEELPRRARDSRRSDAAPERTTSTVKTATVSPAAKAAVLVATSTEDTAMPAQPARIKPYTPRAAVSAR